MVSDHCPVFSTTFYTERENGYSEGKGGHSNINVNIGKAGRGYEGL